MIYSYPLTIPANTLEADKLKFILPLDRGEITRVMVQFPSGHMGLTHVGLNRGLHQLYPTNPEATFSSSSETIVWDEELPSDTPPYQLEAYAWNEDTTYDHTITVRVVLKALVETTGLVDEIKKLFGLGGES